MGISRKTVLYGMKTEEIAIRMSERYVFKGMYITTFQENFVRRIKELFEREE
jgi:hypothetical protein